MNKSQHFSKSTIALVAISILVSVFAAKSAAAESETTPAFTLLYSFQGASGENPLAGVVMDSSGTLYGTTSEGGANGDGAVFTIAADGTESLLYSFKGGADGSFPLAPLTFDSSGNIYGTTTLGGKYGYGTVFKLASNGDKSLVYSFGAGNHDGRYPSAGVLLDKQGTIFGTTQDGGGYGCGTVFKIDANGKESIMHNFKGVGPGHPADGAYPIAGLIRDHHGNLYGTTELGGASNDGTVFKIDSTGRESLLLSLDGKSGGGYPFGGVVMDAQGNLYGTAAYGGDGIGVTFELSPAGKETPLHTFQGGDDGDYPSSGLAIDKHGNLYGTTEFGGLGGAGVLYKITTAGKFFVQHHFDGSDGGDLLTSPFADDNGNVYGTATEGGANGQGSVFKLSN
ncbi:MAG TPA: choice-of-anchor tandem repeat GloVer-containing protein [Terriglobales bacterium]